MISRHCDPNDLAALAEGREPAGSDNLHAHLAQCRTCLATYAEAVRVAHRTAAGVPGETVPRTWLSEALAAGAKPQRANVGVPRRVWVPAVAVFVLALVWFVAPTNRSGELTGDQIGTISLALREQSVAGPVFPGVSPDQPDNPTVYRSGNSPADDVSAILRGQAGRRQSVPADPESAYWLAAGYLAAGQIGTATDLVRLARQTYPQDRRLLILDALAAYRRSELTRAESLLHQALDRDPTDDVARFDLAVILQDAGRTWEARQLLAAGAWPATELLSRRAQALRDTLHTAAGGRP